VLLTRSRLCPGPKPGSSLHLHVLGTPPAFVLSQDQTLREELPQRVVRNARSLRAAASCVATGDCSESWACPWWDQALAPTARPARGQDETASPAGRAGVLEPDVHEGLQSARRGQFWHRRSSCSPRGERPSDGVEPGHIFRPGSGRRVCMLLSFQRPSHRFWRGILLRGAPRCLNRTGGGPTSIALNTDVVAKRRKAMRRVLVRVGQHRTWTTIVRCRGRSSKSMSTICCQVPSARRPSTMGIVSDGPITAARRWAWELESWLSRLWA
jgi:hypothetical protein